MLSSPFHPISKSPGFMCAICWLLQTENATSGWPMAFWICSPLTVLGWAAHIPFYFIGDNACHATGFRTENLLVLTGHPEL